MTGAVVVALALLMGCQRRNESPVDKDSAHSLFDEIKIDTPPGMSDLTTDEHGILWATPENEHVIIEIDPSKSPPSIVSHPLRGLGSELETEGLAWLGDNKIAIGIEGTLTPLAAVAYAERRGNEFVVTETKALANTAGVVAEVNRGVEAVCGHGREVLAAGEVPTTEHGKRWAPLVRIEGDRVVGAKLWLTTPKGKISALSCTFGPDGTAQVIAVERHYGVCRILKFTVTRDATEITPTVDIDLWPLLHDNFNMEGITRLADGRMVLINDNQSGDVSGPTELFVFHPR